MRREEYPFYNPDLDELVGELTDSSLAEDKGYLNRLCAGVALNLIADKERGVPPLLDVLSTLEDCRASTPSELAEFHRAAVTVRVILGSGAPFQDSDLRAILDPQLATEEKLALSEPLDVEYLINQLDCEVLGAPYDPHISPSCARRNIPPELEMAIGRWFLAIRNRKGEGL